MPTRNLRPSLAAMLLAAVAANAVPAASQAPGPGAPAFGSPEDVAFARDLWQALADARIVGENAIQTHPYAGTSQHGPVVQYLDGTVTMDGRTGTFIAKRNYRAEDISVEEVFRDPSSHFDSLGVMFRREEGYAPESRNWFWVKYMPDGTVATTPDGRDMAGKVPPCISCHEPADGNDFVWSHDRFAQ